MRRGVAAILEMYTCVGEGGGEGGAVAEVGGVTVSNLLKRVHQLFPHHPLLAVFLL